MTTTPPAPSILKTARKAFVAGAAAAVAAAGTYVITNGIKFDAPYLTGVATVLLASFILAFAATYATTNTTA